MVIIDEIYAILTSFGGGRGGDPGNVAVRFLLPSFFWSVLAWIAFKEWGRGGDKKDFYVGIASLLGMLRELLMFTAEYGSWRGMINFDNIYFYYPPFEHAATMFSCIFIGTAFLHYLRAHERMVKIFFFSASVLTGFLYVVIAPAWYNFLSQQPGAPFGLFWGDLAFRITASIFMGFLVFILLLISQEGHFVSRTLIVGFTFLFLDEFLMIFNIASHERYVQYFAPLRHNLHIWAIPLFILFYWTDLRRRFSEAEKLINNSFRLSQIMLTVFDRNGIVKVASPAAADIAGVSPEQMQGRDIKDFFRLADGSDYLHALRDSVEFEDKFVLFDGTVRHLSWNIHRSSDDGYFYASVSDNTRPKLIEEALAGAQKTAWSERTKADSILDVIEDGVSILDRDFRISYQNRKSKEMLGDHLGELCYFVYAKQRRICIDCPMVECFNEGGIQIVERMISLGDNKKPCKITLVPLRDETGNIVGGIKIFKEIDDGRATNKILQNMEHGDDMVASCASIPERIKTVNKEQNLLTHGAGRVLLMDDEDGVREIAGEILRSAGYSVELADDGKKAIELFRAAIDKGKPFDVVVLDLTVPGGLGGRETLKKLLEIAPDVRAIVSSGYSDDAVMSDYQVHGFCGIVPKPYYPQDLCNAVFKAVSMGKEKNETA